ncbi:MAG: methylated-DNA--[protein]-cysteine S-methyltransferase [Bacteroidales bacterium]
MDYVNQYLSPLGIITLASDGKYLKGLWFNDQKYFASTLNKEYQIKDLPIFSLTCNWLDEYFDGKNPSFIPPIKIITTPFRQKILDILMTIPYGSIITYKTIATQIVIQEGVRHMSSQAVGSAVGHNPISLIVPCHRVIGSQGKLTGYAGGISKKLKLLQLEGVDISKLKLTNIN